MPRPGVQTDRMIILSFNQIQPMNFILYCKVSCIKNVRPQMSEVGSDTVRSNQAGAATRTLSVLHALLFALCALQFCPDTRHLKPRYA